MKRVRIAYLLGGIATDLGGTEKQLLRTIEGLDRKQFEPSVVLLNETPWTRANQLPCPSFALGHRGFLDAGFPAVVQRLRRYVREQRIDVLQVFFEEPLFVAYLATLLYRGKPKMVASRRDLGLTQQPWYHHLFQIARPHVLRRFSAVLVNGMAVKQHAMAQDGVPEERIRVIHNGIQLPVPATESPPLFRESAADIWIAVVANLNPVKRHDIFLQALEKLKAECAGWNVRAILLGQGQEEARLRRLAANLGVGERVHFVGAVSNVGAYLQNVDIGVLCSDREGSSNAVMEYMAFGLPVVVTAVGGNPELVDESNGFCIPSADPDALCAALAKLIRGPDLRCHMGIRSREKIERSFSWDRTLGELETFYLELLRLSDVQAHENENSLARKNHD